MITGSSHDMLLSRHYNKNKVNQKKIEVKQPFTCSFSVKPPKFEKLRGSYPKLYLFFKIRTILDG